MTPDVSLRQLFHQHAAFVWRSLKYLGVAERDLPDQVQEVFLVVHRKLPTFEERSSLRTWLYGICLRNASDYRRRAQRREVPTGLPPAEPHAQDPGDELERARARRRLLQTLERLEPAQREVFVLYELEGLPMKEVVALCGCPLQTGYSRLHAARRAVHAAFEEGADE